MITITLNAKSMTVPPNLSLAELLRHLNYQHNGIAIAVNRDFIPHSNYSTTLLNSGDQVEIVAPMQGG